MAFMRSVAVYMDLIQWLHNQSWPSSLFMFIKHTLFCTRWVQLIKILKRMPHHRCRWASWTLSPFTWPYRSSLMRSLRACFIIVQLLKQIISLLSSCFWALRAHGSVHTELNYENKTLHNELVWPLLCRRAPCAYLYELCRRVRMARNLWWTLPLCTWLCMSWVQFTVWGCFIIVYMSPTRALSPCTWL